VKDVNMKKTTLYSFLAFTLILCWNLPIINITTSVIVAFSLGLLMIYFLIKKRYVDIGLTILTGVLLLLIWFTLKQGFFKPNEYSVSSAPVFTWASLKSIKFKVAISVYALTQAALLVWIVAYMYVKKIYVELKNIDIWWLFLIMSLSLFPVLIWFADINPIDNVIKINAVGLSVGSFLVGYFAIYYKKNIPIVVLIILCLLGGLNLKRHILKKKFISETSVFSSYDEIAEYSQKDKNLINFIKLSIPDSLGVYYLSESKSLQNDITTEIRAYVAELTNLPLDSLGCLKNGTYSSINESIIDSINLNCKDRINACNCLFIIPKFRNLSFDTGHLMLNRANYNYLLHYKIEDPFFLQELCIHDGDFSGIMNSPIAYLIVELSNIKHLNILLNCEYVEFVKKDVDEDWAIFSVKH